MGEENEVDRGRASVKEGEAGSGRERTRALSQGGTVGVGGGGLLRGPVGGAAVEEDADVVDVEEIRERHWALRADCTCERPESDHAISQPACALT